MAFRLCRFCGGKGCLACFGELQRFSPELARHIDSTPTALPEPLFVAHYDNPEEMATLRRVFNRESLEHAFGPDGHGLTEIVQKLRGAPSEAE